MSQAYNCLFTECHRSCISARTRSSFLHCICSDHVYSVMSPMFMCGCFAVTLRGQPRTHVCVCVCV